MLCLGFSCVDFCPGGTQRTTSKRGHTITIISSSCLKFLPVCAPGLRHYPVQGESGDLLLVQIKGALIVYLLQTLLSDTLVTSSESLFNDPQPYEPFNESLGLSSEQGNGCLFEKPHQNPQEMRKSPFIFQSSIQEPGAKAKASTSSRARGQAEQLRDTQSHKVKSCSWILNGVDNFQTDCICGWYVKTRVMKSYPSGHIWIIAQVRQASAPPLQEKL